MGARDIGREILEVIREIKAYKAGKIKLNTHGSRPNAEIVRAQKTAMERAWDNTDGVWNDL